MVGVGEIFLTLMGLSLGGAGWMWREARTLDSDYGEDFEELRDYRAGTFRAELHEVFMDVIEEIDLVEYQVGTDRPATVMEAMDVVVRESMEDVEDALRDYDSLVNKLEEAETNYANASKFLVYAAVAALAISLVSAEVPSGDQSFSLSIFFGFFWALFTYSGLDNWYSAFGAEREVKGAVREYKSE